MSWCVIWAVWFDNSAEIDPKRNCIPDDIVEHEPISVIDTKIKFC